MRFRQKKIESSRFFIKEFIRVAKLISEGKKLWLWSLTQGDSSRKMFEMSDKSEQNFKCALLRQFPQDNRE